MVKMVISRGVRGAHKFATGQATLDAETAENLVHAVNIHYPGKTNGSLKGSLEIIVEEFLEIPAEITPADAEKLMHVTNTDTICKALVALGLQRLSQNGNSGKAT